MRATLFDYGAGNLHSIAKALRKAGVDVAVEVDPERLAESELLVLPGVGAFGAAASRLSPGRARLQSALSAGLPCIGICLGMQLLFEASDEGEGAGLGIFPGRVTRLTARRVPHMGWNDLEPVGDPLFTRAPLATAYFAHGYACRPAEPGDTIAWCTHESDRFAAVVRRGRTLGVQFHPEKSSRDGVRFLAACLEEVIACA